MAMMLAANGAEGETKDEILEALNVSDLNEFNESTKNLIEKYNSMKETTLNIANSIWLNKDKSSGEVKFKDEYKKIVEDYYFGEVREVNQKDLVETVNDWIAKKTKDKIKDVLSRENEDALSILVNTLYFKGDWASKFEKNSTYEETFTSRNNEEKDIDFMHEFAKYDYYEDDNMKMLKLPYEGEQTAMYFVIPTNEDKMDISRAINNMQNYKVRVAIPLFKTEYRLSFVDTLKKLGINKAFSGGAEFKDKMYTGANENVFIEDVIQKTFIEINENGTEAAAATAVEMKEGAAMPPEGEIIKDFKADKPFIYFIMDEITKEVLFIGEYAFAE